MFLFAYFGKSRLVKYFGASEPNEREAYVTVLKAFFSKSWHPKMIQQSSNVFLFKLQSVFFPDRHQRRWIKVQSESACWFLQSVERRPFLSWIFSYWFLAARDQGWWLKNARSLIPWNFPGSRILVRSTFGIGIVVSSKRLVLQTSWWGWVAQVLDTDRVFCLVRWIKIENWWLFFGWGSTLDGNSPSNSSFISLNDLIALLEELDGPAVNLHESVWIPQEVLKSGEAPWKDVEKQDVSR